jgi:hypothetical protein
VLLRGRDARLPFVLSNLVLLVTAMALSKVEPNVAETSGPSKPRRLVKPFGAVPVAFIAAMVILAFGYQLHFSINREPFYLRFARPTDLQWLMPVFWIGFNIAMFPASAIVKYHGALMVIGARMLVGRGRRIAGDRGVDAAGEVGQAGGLTSASFGDGPKEPTHRRIEVPGSR